MELKVWVDGIQRVVCGASYNTTCQDVVIALASAMGQTGRFTLVEKWRDSERPLFPGECPLQALHKWGEYAGEVRFYLVQAATVNVKQKEGGQQKWEEQTQKLNVINKFSPLQSSQNHLNLPEAESLKRSSTFSGAHRTNYTPLLSTSSISSHKSAALFNSKSNQHNTVPSSTALARGQPAGIASVPNGEMPGFSSPFISDSSSKSPSELLSRFPRTTISEGLSSGLHPPVRKDARQLHPANMPEALSSKINPYQSGPSFKQSTSPKSALMMSQHPSTQHQKYSQVIPLSSVMPAHETSSTYHNLLDTTASQSFPSPQLQHSLSSQQFHSQSHLLQQHLKPQAQFQPLSSSAGHEKTPPPNSRRRQERQQQRDRSQDRKAQVSQSATSSSDHHTISKTMLNNNNRTETTQIDTTVYGHRYDNNLYNTINTARGIDQEMNSDWVPHGLQNSFSSGLQNRVTSQDSSHYEYHNRTDLVKSSTLDRRMAQSKVNDLPSRSYSTGDSSNEYVKHSHEGQASNLQQQVDVSHHQQGGVGNKLNFVDSALMKHQKPGTDGYNQRTSSFSPEVAHVRSQGDTSLKSSKIEMDTRQHILNNTKEDSSGERNIQNSTMAVHGNHALGEVNSRTDTSSTDQQYKLQPLQFGNKSSLPFNSISSTKQISAFTPVSPKPSHESNMSVAYNLNNMDASSENSQIHELSNSSQTSLEIEEYDLDRNFPDILHRDAGGGGGGAHRLSMSAKQYLEDGMALSQSERDYMQLLRIVSVQQERIKTQEALINDAIMEIAVLEEEESSKLAQLEMLTEDVSHLEKQEVQLHVELEELERIDWGSVQDSEQKRETDISLQVKSVKEGLEKMEWQMKQLSEQADQISKDLKTEEEHINNKKKKNKELEKKIMLEMVRLNDQLAGLNQKIDGSGKKLKDVEKKILEADLQLKQQEEKVNSLTEKLKAQDLTSSWSPQPSQEASSSPAAVLGPDAPGSVNTLSTTDNGEAILKILEGQFSPENGGDGYGSISSAHHMYKSAMAIKNPNGVWV